MFSESCIQGAISIMPMKPRTIEGRNPSISSRTLKKFLILRGAISAVKTASASAAGMAIKLDRRVAAKVPATSAAIPSAGGSSVGYQSLEKNSSLSEAVRRTGSPFATRKPRMKTRIMIPVTATQKTVRDIILSPLPPKACSFAGRSAFVSALMGCMSSSCWR